MSSFPFDNWLRLAVTVMHISPSDFWAMSVREWLTLCTISNPPLGRDDLSKLSEKFPDKKASHDSQ